MQSDDLRVERWWEMVENENDVRKQLERQSFVV
jgi:hypothetical protein